MSRSANTFDDLMSQMGVRRMDTPVAPPGRKKAPPAKAVTAPGLVPALAPVTVAAPTPVPAPRLPDPLPGRLAAAEARVGVLETERAALLARVEAAEAAAATIAEAAPGSLPALLAERGLRAPAEVNALFKALGEAALAQELVQLAATDARAAAAWLEDRISVVCDRCPPSPGRPVVLVAPARCEVCGGADIKRVVRVFIDAALMEGRTRVVVMGGVPRAQRQLRELVAHRRLVLEPRPLPARWVLRGQAPAGPSDVVLIWDRRAAELLAQGIPAEWSTAMVRAIPEPTLAGLLERATEALRHAEGAA